VNKHTVSRLLLGAAILAALLTVGSWLRSAQAAPAGQQDAPQLTIVKTVAGEETIARGQTVRFTITISNTGSVTATNVIVQDDYDQVILPTIRILSDGGAETGSGENDGDIITWRLGDLPPSAGWSGSYEATATDAFEAGISEVVNVASVQADNMEGGAQATVVLVVQAPKLTLSMERERVEGTGRVFPGDTVRYTIRYINNGMVEATNVVLEAAFDEAVVQWVGNVTADGQLDGAIVRWNLGTVAAGVSGNASYETTIKSVVPLGTKVRSQATIRAEHVTPLSVSDSLSLPPQLIVKREREDLNGGAIEPGDTLRFIIHFSNAGSVEAADVAVCDDFDERVVAEVSDISDGGGEVDGAVEWTLVEPLGPGAEKMVSYKIRLIGEIDESTTAANTASISIGGVEVDRSQTTMTIEPPPEAAPPVTITVPESPGIFEDQPTLLAVLVGVLSVAALLAVDGLALLILKKGEWKEGHFRLVMEGIAIVVIAAAVLILAINKTIESDGAVSILSSVAGYVLGRTVSGSKGQ